MPNTREKLIELLKEADRYEFEEQKKNGTFSMEAGWKLIADHLIANGVTIQKWIPVTERLLDPFEIVYVYDQTGKRVTDAYMTRHKEWVGVCMNHEVTHWMPLPEPPKGE